MQRERKQAFKQIAIEFTGQVTDERFVEVYADKILKRERLSADQPEARAREVLAEADRRAAGQAEVSA